MGRERRLTFSKPNLHRKHICDTFSDILSEKGVTKIKFWMAGFDGNDNLYRTRNIDLTGNNYLYPEMIILNRK